MIFINELLVYIPYFIEAFLLLFLLLRQNERYPKFKVKIALLLTIGIIWQIPISLLIYMDIPRLESLIGVIKFFDCFLPLFFFQAIYKITFLDISYNLTLSLIFQRWANLFAGIIVGFSPFLERFFLDRIISIISFMIVLIPVYFLYIRNKVKSEVDEDGISLLLFVMLFILFELAQVIVRNNYEGKSWQLALSIIEIIFLIFMLYQSIRVEKKNKQRMEKAISDVLLQKEKQQFELLKSNMENLQSQAHDMKYILRILNEGNIDDEIKNKFSSSINIFDNTFDTGNASLDIILTDAKNKFDAKKIKFECLTEKCDLSFIHNYDLYSLLGNAFDNATEYLVKVDETKRYVSFILKKNNEFIFAEISNYYEENQDVFVGIKTTKADKINHGYGIKNMKKIADKYYGEFFVFREDKTFKVRIIIPITNK